MAEDHHRRRRAGGADRRRRLRRGRRRRRRARGARDARAAAPGHAGRPWRRPRGPARLLHRRPALAAGWSSATWSARSRPSRCAGSGARRLHRGRPAARTPPAGLLPHARPPAPPGPGGPSTSTRGPRALHGEAAARAAANARRGHHLRLRPRPALGRLRLGPAAARHRAATPSSGGPSAAGPGRGRPACRRGPAQLGVRIATSSRVDRLPAPPVIVATQLESARSPARRRPASPGRAGACVLLDVGLAPDGATRSPSPISTTPVSSSGSAGPTPSLAPAGHSLRAGRHAAQAGGAAGAAHGPAGAPARPRLSGLAGPARLAARGGRRRPLRCPGPARAAPGATGRRSTVADGVFLAGDLVAAPGLRAEVSINSGVLAARARWNTSGWVTRGWITRV